VARFGVRYDSLDSLERDKTREKQNSETRSTASDSGRPINARPRWDPIRRKQLSPTRQFTACRGGTQEQRQNMSARKISAKGRFGQQHEAGIGLI